MLGIMRKVYVFPSQASVFTQTEATGVKKHDHFCLCDVAAVQDDADDVLM